MVNHVALGKMELSSRINYPLPICLRHPASFGTRRVYRATLCLNVQEPQPLRGFRAPPFIRLDCTQHDRDLPQHEEITPGRHIGEIRTNANLRNLGAKAVPETLPHTIEEGLKSRCERLLFRLGE